MTNGIFAFAGRVIVNILAIDTSDRVLSVALSVENAGWYMEIDDGSRHSELLMDCIETLFKTADFKPSRLNSVVCMKGPGSFTGLRIGFSAAKGLAAALGLPVYSIPTLDCLAHHLAFWPGIVIPSIDAKKNCFFSALYRDGKPLTAYLDASPEELAAEILNISSPSESIILTGGGAEMLKTQISPHISGKIPIIDPEFNRGRARELIKITNNVNIVLENSIDSGPAYFRKSDAELNCQ